MALVVIAALATLFLWALLHPFFKQAAQRATDTAGPSAIQHLFDCRETLLQALRELENDLKLGSLTQEDYQRLRTETEAEAISVLRALDEAAAGVADEVEADILAVRTRSPAATAPAHPEPPKPPIRTH